MYCFHLPAFSNCWLELNSNWKLAYIFQAVLDSSTADKHPWTEEIESLESELLLLTTGQEERLSGLESRLDRLDEFTHADVAEAMAAADQRVERLLRRVNHFVRCK